MNADANSRNELSWDDLLSTIFYRQSCPSAEMLADYAMKLLAPGQRLVVAQHLRRCPHCTEELGLFAEPGQTPGFIAQLVNRVRWAVAHPALQPAPLRGSSLRQLVYTAEETTIDIETAPSPGGFDRLRLTGEIVSPIHFTEAELWDEEQAQTMAVSAVDEGYFDMTGLARASYLLCLKTDGAELWLGPLRVESEADSP